LWRVVAVKKGGQTEASFNGMSDDMSARQKQFHEACMNWLNSADEPKNRDDKPLKSFWQEEYQDYHLSGTCSGTSNTIQTEK